MERGAAATHQSNFDLWHFAGEREAIYLKQVIAAAVMIFSTGPSLSFGAVDVGRCSLNQDPRTHPPLVHACVRAEVELDILKDERAAGTASLNSGRFYLGLHVNDIFSVHGEFSGYVLSPRKIDDQQRFRRAPDNLYLAISNLTLSRWQLLLGRFYTPFGVNKSPSLPIFDLIYKRHFFWRTSKPALSFSYSDLAGTKLEVSFSRPGEEKNTEAGEGEPNDMAIRFSSDLSALGGTRLVFSYSKNSLDIVRYGFALWNLSAKGGETLLEWLRYKDSSFDGSYPFQQLIRFYHIGGYRFGGRHIFEYEDDLERYFLTQVGHDRMLAGPVTMRIALGYYKARLHQRPNHWVLGVGLRCEL